MSDSSTGGDGFIPGVFVGLLAGVTLFAILGMTIADPRIRKSTSNRIYSEAKIRGFGDYQIGDRGEIEFKWKSRWDLNEDGEAK